MTFRLDISGIIDPLRCKAPALGGEAVVAELVDDKAFEGASDEVLKSIPENVTRVILVYTSGSVHTLRANINAGLVRRMAGRSGV